MINRHGIGKYYSEGKEELYEGMFVNDKKEGNGTLIWSNGEVYEGKWYGNKRITPKKPTKIITVEEYNNMVGKFLKEKSVIEPKVKIL